MWDDKKNEILTIFLSHYDLYISQGDDQGWPYQVLSYEKI